MKIYPNDDRGKITPPGHGTMSIATAEILGIIPKRSHHKKPPVTKLGDTFTTLSGETMTRRQLSNLLARANRTIKKKIAEAPTERKAKRIGKLFKEGIASTGVYEPGADRYTLKGITDPRQLKRLEASARKALGSTLVNTRSLKESERKRMASLSDPKHKIIRELGKGGEEDYEVLKELWESEEWETIRSSGWYDSGDLLREVLAVRGIASGLADVERAKAIRSVIKLYGDAVRESKLEPDSKKPLEPVKLYDPDDFDDPSEAEKAKRYQEEIDKINRISDKELRIQRMLSDLAAAAAGTLKIPEVPEDFSDSSPLPPIK